jgi:mevalonate kinase
VEVHVAEAPDDDPLATAVRVALAHAGTDPASYPDWLVEVASTVPVGAGLGSSAAVAVALVNAIARAAGAVLDRETAALLAYEAEACTHGTPSGIDNTVVAYDRPIRFISGRAEELDVAAPLTFVVADTGVQGLTAEAVAGVRQRRQANPTTYEAWFDEIGRFVDQAARAIATGELIRLGWLLNSNHLVLQAMRVSNSRVDALVAAARHAGALGAKLSGAGAGGVVIALATNETVDEVADAMRGSGAVRAWRTHIAPSGE